jgi:hypothetical protein
MMKAVPKSLLYTYAGLPPAWASDPIEEINEAVEMRVRNAVKNINNTKTGASIFITGNVAHLLRIMESEGVALSDLYGYDFAEFFAAKFNKSGAPELITKRYTFVYNVGLEEALNKDFASQVLRSLIARLEDKNSIVFIVSELSYSRFEKTYGFKPLNYITLPEKKEPVIF